MKKLLIVTLSILLAGFLNFNQSEALSVSDFSPVLDKKVANMKTTEEKVKYLKSFSDLLTQPQFTRSKDAKVFADVREYSLNMLRVFENELQEEQTKKSSKNQTSSKTTTYKNNSKSITNLPKLSDNLSNIDEQKVRDAILSWHNEERDDVWVDPYTYNLALEWSATTRANEIVKSWKIWNFHARNSGDWYYNYNSILNWLSDLWINFPSIKWTTSFSESVWYNTYKCSKSDCTQDLITAIKKTWTWLIMKEKKWNGGHYRAAIMKHFTQMWVWIAIDKSINRYYVVLHYSVDF